MAGKNLDDLRPLSWQRAIEKRLAHIVAHVHIGPGLDEKFNHPLGSPSCGAMESRFVLVVPQRGISPQLEKK